MQCQNCQATLAEGSTFCPSCGSPQGQANPVPGQNPQYNAYVGQQQPANPYTQQQGYQPNQQYRQYQNVPMPASDDAPNTGFMVLCIFFPVVGLILYLVWKDQYPQKAKSCGKGAIIGVIICAALSCLAFVLTTVFSVSLASSAFNSISW